MAKMEMMVENQNQSLVRLLDKLRSKSSVFFYSKDSNADNFLKLVCEELRNNNDNNSLPSINIYWNENDRKTKEETKNDNSFYLFRNFTASMIKIVKLLSQEQHLILPADLSSLNKEQNVKPYIQFFMTLLRKSTDYKSTVLTSINEELIEKNVDNDLIPYFDNIFIIRGKRITQLPDKKLDIIYSTEGDTLHVEPYLQADMNKIKEIFSLTPEEKEELDKIVGRSLEEYRTSM